MSYNLPEGWKTVKLEQLGEVVGGGTPSTKKSEYYDGGNIPWLTPKDLSGYRRRHISRGERNITKEGLANSSAKIYPAGTVLFSSRAPIGYIAIAKNEISTNQGFKSVIPYKDITTSDYIYYLLMHNTEKIKSISSGSTFKEVSGTVMKNFIVNVPPYNEQVQIASILSSFDDKIENNNAIIANLEAQAQAIFKSWFIDFEPFQ
ncbi:MAG: restriction endonuclease subunit S, partial [Tissierellia bacterium]|nr:restriction endonuclease subunit S [Tissierellia bacterium]